MKKMYYSEVLNRYFDTETACKDAEAAEAERKAAEEKKANERKNRYQEILDAKAEYKKIRERCVAELDAQKQVINDLVTKFNEDYGKIRVEYNETNRPKDWTEEVIAFFKAFPDPFDWLR